MAKSRTKSKWKSIVCGIVVVAVLIACVAGIAVLSKRETKSISSLAFEEGGLNAEGVFDPEVENAIFTEEMFECMGLVIETDVKFTDKFQVFFYNFDGVFLSSSEQYTKTTRLEVPELAKYARVVIYADEEIKWYEMNKLARMLDIKVDREQNFELYNYFSMIPDNLDSVYTYNYSQKKASIGHFLYYTEPDSDLNVYSIGWSPCKPINVEGWNNLIMKFEKAEDAEELIYFFTMVNKEGVEVIVPLGTHIQRLNGGMTEFIIEVPEGAETFYTNTLTASKHHYVINQYN